MIGVNLVVDIPLALHFNVFWPTGEIPKGLLGEPSDWLYEFLVHPTIIAYFVWIQSSGQKLFAELARRDIVPEDHLEKVIDRLDKRLKSRRAWIAGIVFGLIFAIWFTMAFGPELSFSPYEKAPYDSWLIKDPAIALIRSPIIFVVFYALVVAIFYSLPLIILAVNDAFRYQDIRVEPLNSDSSGGLGFISHFSAKLGYLIAVLGVLLIARIMANITRLGDPARALDPADLSNYVFLLGIGAYLILSPVPFLWPLWMAHKAMIRYRDGLLNGISKRYSVLLTGLTTYSDKSEPVNENLLKQIRQVDEARTAIKKQVPTWPFNTSSLGKFLGLTLSPLVGGIIKAILDRLIS
jgi:hypothetical protein